MNQLPYLLPWVRVLLLIRSITSTDWDDTTGRLVQPLLRARLEMRRQIARDEWRKLGAASIWSNGPSIVRHRPPDTLIWAEALIYGATADESCGRSRFNGGRGPDSLVRVPAAVTLG
jgi:hypothetical protein